MENKHIDKIAAGLTPDRREGAKPPGAGAELLLSPTLVDTSDASHSLSTLGDTTDASHSLLPHSSRTLSARSVIYRHTDSLVTPHFLEEIVSLKRTINLYLLPLQQSISKYCSLDLERTEKL